MSFSWVDPHFATLYARREDLRLAEKLLREARQRELRLPELGGASRHDSAWAERQLPGSPNLRLI